MTYDEVQDLLEGLVITVINKEAMRHYRNSLFMEPSEGYNDKMIDVMDGIYATHREMVAKYLVEKTGGPG